MRDGTSAGEELQRIAERGGVATMPLRALSALLFLGGILYALLSGNWGIGAIAFGLGAVMLGLSTGSVWHVADPNAPSGGC
jgi:hypothetical protein